MSELNLMKIFRGQNIALIYFLSVVAYLMYYFVNYNQSLLRESTPLLILGTVFLILELLLIILPAVAAGVGLKQKTLKKFPAILTIIAAVLLILYIISMAGNLHSLYRVVVDVPKMIFFLALTLSLLYGFAAFAPKIDSQKIKAAKVFGVFHAVFGVAMTFFYYKIYNAAQMCTVGEIPKPDVWYYSPESLIVGFGIWAVLGLVAGILLMTVKQKTEDTENL